MEAAQKNSTPISPPLELPATDFLDWVLFVPFVLTFFLILLILDPIQRIAILISKRFHESIITLLNHLLHMSLSILGTKTVITFREQPEPGAVCIIISNHQSLFDIPLLYNIFVSQRPRFISKKELGRWIPSISFNLRNGDNALIDRKNPRQAIPTIRNFGKTMHEKKLSAVIFPEGTRARDGQLKKFHPAGFSALLDEVPEVKIIPVTIDGSWKLAGYKHGPIPRGQTIRVVVGEPIDRTKFPETIEMMAEVAVIIRKTLEELRGETRA